MFTNGTFATNDLVLIQLSNISNKTIEFIESNRIRVPENNWSPQKEQVLKLEQIKEVLTLALVTVMDQLKKELDK